MSLNAYQLARSITETPRAAEYRLLTQITGDMLDAQRADLRGAALMPVLHRNREVWGAFSLACGTPGNQLPDALRASIMSLGLWVNRFTSQVMAGKASIEALITVNRSILEGLAGPAA